MQTKEKKQTKSNLKNVNTVEPVLRGHPREMAK